MKFYTFIFSLFCLALANPQVPYEGRRHPEEKATSPIAAINHADDHHAVSHETPEIQPTIDPKDRQYAGPAYHQEAPSAMFKAIGVTSAAMEFANVHFSFKLDEFSIHLSFLEHAVNTAFENRRKEDTTSDVSVTYELLHARVDMLIHRLQVIRKVSLLTSESSDTYRPDGYGNHYSRWAARQGPKPRRKRFIVTALVGAIVFAAIGTAVNFGFNFHNREELRHTQTIQSLHNDRLTAVEEANNIFVGATTKLVYNAQELASVVNAALEYARSEDLRITQKLVWLEHAFYVAETQMGAAEAAIRSASNNKLDIAVIQSIDADEVFAAVNMYAESVQMIQVSAEGPADWVNYPSSISYLAGGFRLSVRVPLSREDSLLALFQLLPLPIPGPDGIYFSLSHSDNAVLGITDKDNKFLVTDLQTLASDCTKMGNFYACPKNNVLRSLPSTDNIRKDDDDLCPFALFTGATDVARITCAAHIINPRPMAVQVSARRFAVFGDFSGNITCRTSHITGSFRSTGVGSINLPAGCSASTDFFDLHSADSSFTRSDAKWATAIPLEGNTASFLHDLDTTKFLELRNRTDHIVSSLDKISVRDAIVHVNRDKNIFANVPLISSWSSALDYGSTSFATIVAIIALAHGVYLHFTRAPRPQHHPQPPLAPAAATLILNRVPDYSA